MRRSWIVILLLGGCASDSDPEEFRVRDQSGGEFLWVDEHVHRIAGVSPELPTCAADERADYTYYLGRFVNVAGMCWELDGTGGWSSGAFGRYLVCERDDDCPPLARHGETYECRAGFCQNADIEAHPPGIPGYSDMVTLCQGNEPRPEVIDVDSDPTLDLALDVACPGQYGQTDEPCLSIPDDCPDPG